jgi:hypothetical protein
MLHGLSCEHGCRSSDAALLTKTFKDVALEAGGDSDEGAAATGECPETKPRGAAYLSRVCRREISHVAVHWAFLRLLVTAPRAYWFILGLQSTPISASWRR